RRQLSRDIDFVAVTLPEEVVSTVERKQKQEETSSRASTQSHALNLAVYSPDWSTCHARFLLSFEVAVLWRTLEKKKAKQYPSRFRQLASPSDAPYTLHSIYSFGHGINRLGFVVGIHRSTAASNSKKDTSCT
ncbi:hypothetical protein ATANTOWER_029155, partial [Ataeniobius toweri]|nr:hypothetical protein [Ataeniobius toweri]